MVNQNQSVLAPYIERARKVLQHEQRTHHQDQAIKPGGLEVFVSRWADETTTVCKKAALDQRPIYRFIEQLEGYHGQDPLQRASSLRAALAVLNELDGQSVSQPVSLTAPQAAHASAPVELVRSAHTPGHEPAQTTVPAIPSRMNAMLEKTSSPTSITQPAEIAKATPGPEKLRPV